MTKFRLACAHCGNEDVSRDAWADWHVEQQAWVLRTVFDYAYCHACDRETRLQDVLLEDDA